MSVCGWNRPTPGFLNVLSLVDLGFNDTGHSSIRGKLPCDAHDLESIIRPQEEFIDIFKSTVFGLRTEEVNENEA